ncbi:unnamed protein product [Ilex paraguariensis]|uniref:Nodulation-signaling pathway 2 protein n=1 Tax=Ilex paraguariensis TaxID=185542 RepID=A0ABC8UPY3_9AQUA
MMQTRFLQPSSWPFHNIINTTLDQTGFYGLNMDTLVVDDHEFSSLFTNTEDSSEISSDPNFQTTFSSDEYVQLPILDDDEMQVITYPGENFCHDMADFEPISSGAIEDLGIWLDERDGDEGYIPPELSNELDLWSPCLSVKSSEASVVLPSLILPRDEMEIDIQLGLHHLLKAYGEAMEMGQRELVKVLVRSIKEKANPIGEALQRVTFNFFQSTENQGDYLKQESIKNFEAAFKAFYQMFPYGRFAHFAANSAILEAIPDDAEVIHIVDFDIGEGVQYPPMIEAIVQKQKTLRLTSIKSENVSNFARWKFEDTKKRLFDHARPFGLKLQVEETSMKDLVSEIKGSKGGEREWLAFNCMVGLPHMGRRRSMSHVMEFLKISKELLAYSATSKGVVTFGDGEAEERQRNCSEYGSFFDGHLRHYQALSESMEWNFPDYLTEARIAMESLFVAPYVCSSSWFHKWEETREGFDLQDGAGLQGWRLNKEMLTEAREIVKKGESSYEIRIEEQIENEMVLTWKGTPLVRVSTWM